MSFTSNHCPTKNLRNLRLREAERGSTVFMERVDRHQLSDRWVELPVTGVFEVQDGKIVYWRDYFDAATILSAWPAG